MLGWLGKGLATLGNRLSGARTLTNRDVAQAALRGAQNQILARYDAAQNTQENSRRWVGVDLLSARAANSFNVRRQLRIRSRYCRDNNSYAAGIVRNKVADLIGTGPTPKVDCGMGDLANKQIEAAWSSWWKAVDGLRKLQVLATAKVVDGESFFVLGTNQRVEHSVKLYPHDIEADQVTTPQPLNLDMSFTDGLVLDTFGNPVSYTVLKTHPGDFLFPNLNPIDSRTIRADQVIQWFRKDRPGQCRGIPELTPALELFEQMRTFRMATLTAAEQAALIGGILESLAPADTSAYVASPMQSINYERGQLMEGPAGYKLSQLTAKHPNTTYETFIYMLLAEACRCLNVPLNVALGTSQKFNFSSARLDHINYRDGLLIERKDCVDVVMVRLFYAFLEEALMIPGLLPDGLTPETVGVAWHWSGWSYLDPLKDAQADTEQLGNKTKTYKAYYAEQGKEWQAEFEQLAAEKKAMVKLGLTPDDFSPGGAPAAPPATTSSSGKEGGDVKKKPAQPAKAA